MKEMHFRCAISPFRITLNTFAYAGTLAFRPLPGGPKLGRTQWRLHPVENDFKWWPVITRTGQRGVCLICK